jgi:DNA primase
VFAYSDSGLRKGDMWAHLAKLKHQVPLLDYLRELKWSSRRVGSRQEFVGLCPLHTETHPSFYVNSAKNVFYCHGCGRGGDVIRFVQLYFDLPFYRAVAHLQRNFDPRSVYREDLLEETVRFYQIHLHRHVEAYEYLSQRGLHDPDLVQRLGVGYAPGGCLRRHLMMLGYSVESLTEVGLVNPQGRDTFCRRVVFPCRTRGELVNIYGRAIGSASAHRFLSRHKAGLYAWDTVAASPSVILVEGLFDVAVLWQSGFFNVTSALGTNLTAMQFSQLANLRDHKVYLAFDADLNGAGQRAADILARRLVGAGIETWIVRLPCGHDPNSYFVAGATADDFARCLDRATHFSL